MIKLQSKEDAPAVAHKIPTRVLSDLLNDVPRALTISGTLRIKILPNLGSRRSKPQVLLKLSQHSLVRGIAFGLGGSGLSAPGLMPSVD